MAFHKSSVCGISPDLHEKKNALRHDRIVGLAREHGIRAYVKQVRKPRSRYPTPFGGYAHTVSQQFVPSILLDTQIQSGTFKGARGLVRSTTNPLWRFQVFATFLM